jgi:hypothetical protein
VSLGRRVPIPPGRSRPRDTDRLPTGYRSTGRSRCRDSPGVARDFFADRGIDPEIAEVSGATELTPLVDIADAIIDITSTGTTPRVDGPEEIAKVSLHPHRISAEVLCYFSSPGSGC